MDREKAIKYLKRKDKDETDEKEIEKVMKRGKIYGDPLVEMDF